MTVLRWNKAYEAEAIDTIVPVHVRGRVNLGTKEVQTKFLKTYAETNMIGLLMFTLRLIIPVTCVRIVMVV